MDGVGLVYWPELEEIFQEGLEAVSTLVLEPQTFWEKTLSGPRPAYRTNHALLARVAALPQRKLLHGVGAPVGGANDDPLDYMTPLADAARKLEPAWVSEHLSFNRTGSGDESEGVGFLLPPRQTDEGVALAIQNIRRFTSKLRLPFAFETGVNYLKPRSDEMPDGDFFASIAREAPCGILLDLHNVWANERNGRQSVEGVLSALPLDHVWEIHLAGGMDLDGYWLDAHSGPVPPDVLALAREIIPSLPNLGALVFEILPRHAAELGLAGVRKQLDLLRELWTLGRPSHGAPRFVLPRSVSIEPPRAGDIEAWEQALAALVRGLPPGHFCELADDPGVAILRQLVGEFRASFIARGLRYTLILLHHDRGAGFVKQLLEDYFRRSPADAFAAVECDAFARYLVARLPEASGSSPLAQVLAFESALIRASLRGESGRVLWSIDPIRLFTSLDGGTQAAVESCAPFTMTIGAGNELTGFTEA